MSLDIKKIKSDFPIFKEHPNLVYLDTAASSQTPQRVLDSMYEYYTKYRSNIHRGNYELSEASTDSYEESRKKVASFIGAKQDEIIFTGSATHSMNMLVYMLEHSLDFKEGDEIVTSIMEHHSVIIPLQKLADRRKLKIKYIPLSDSFTLDMEKASKLISKRTKIVVITLASNVLGTINDITSLVKVSHDAGALVIVDAAKPAGHIHIDVGALDCDFLFFSGHKMCGPTGIGVLYGKRGLLEKMEPSFFGGGTVSKVTIDEAVFINSPHKFEAGTPNIAGAIGLGEAVDYITTIGLQNIHEHISNITQYLIGELDQIKGVTLYCGFDTSLNSGTVSFTVDNMHPHDVAEIVARGDVALRAGHHCAVPLMQVLGIPATVRASLYMYNTTHDIDILRKQIVKAQKVFA